MKELAEKMLPYIPLFITNLAKCLTGPKTFVRSALAKDEALKQSLIFFGMSVAMTFILNFPARKPGEDFWPTVANLGALMLAIAVIWALGIYLSWRIVGGKADFDPTLTIHLYYLGTFFPVFSMYMFASDGMQIADKSANASTPLDVIAFVCMVSWIIVSWGAYRELNGLTRWRSLLAAVVCGLMVLPGWKVVESIGAWLRSTRLDA